MADMRTGETTSVIQTEATGLPEPFSESWRERRRLITSVCERLVGDLDSSLLVVRKLCSSLDSGRTAVPQAKRHAVTRNQTC